MNISKLAHNPRAIKALTGLSYQEFIDLIPVFERSLRQIQMKQQDRKRKPGAGQKGHLPTTEAKLFFILFYFKTYPTFDILGFLSGKSRGRTCEAVHFYAKVLNRSMGEGQHLPKRRIGDIDEFIRLFPEVKDVFIDGTERQIQRPKKPKNQRKQYSGKKKTTTRKNVVMTDANKRILYLSPTKAGRRHDKRLADKVSLLAHIPPEVAVWVDTGFQGIQKQHPNVCMPKKGTKKLPLTEEEKRENQLISSIRVRVEHALGGMKRFRAVSDRFRNRMGRLDELFIQLAAGLWNYHLSYRY
jgi:hypothetical protein